MPESNQSLETTPKDDSSLKLADIHDRIMDAYYGKLGEQFMRKTQARIHWICSQVTGSRVMDVGCSQGIVPILLAREGLEIIGIDTSPQSIEEAESYLSQEPKHVQKKVTYINADFNSLDVSKFEIDTVVLSEILEHLVKPELCVEKAAKILKKGGTLIITVPFGINDFIDHKHTYYLMKPYEIASKYFADIKVTMLGNWLGIIAKDVIDGEVYSDNLIDHRLISQLENSFNQLERNIREELKTKNERLSNVNTKFLESTTKIKELNKNLSNLDSINKSKENKISALEKKITDLTSLKDNLGQQHKTDTSTIKELERNLSQVTDQKTKSVSGNGAGIPTSTPSNIGDIYVDTTNLKIYIATGTSSSSDWKKVISQ